MAKKSKKGGIPHPTLDKAKNMPGDMPMQNHIFGSVSSGRLKGPGKGKMHEAGGKVHDSGMVTPKSGKKKK